MTFDYEAGAEDKWVAYCKDKTWVDQRGMPGSAIYQILHRNANTTKYLYQNSPTPSHGTLRKTVVLKAALWTSISKKKTEMHTEF